MNEVKIPSKHPRVESLRIREKLVRYYRAGIVAEAGLFAHGRGEAFDYLLGEQTIEAALKATEAAAAAMLVAKQPIISVNGNTAALAAQDLVRLAETTRAKIEVNLFYRSTDREVAIEELLRTVGAKKVLGVGEAASGKLAEIGSERRRVDPEGIMKGDVIVVPLEDGDRTEALVKMGKTVIAIDLNPLSRTAQFAAITIVDNITRAMPNLVEVAERLKKERRRKLKTIMANFSNEENLSSAISVINQRLSGLAETGKYLSLRKRGKS